MAAARDDRKKSMISNGGNLASQITSSPPRKGKCEKLALGEFFIVALAPPRRLLTRGLMRGIVEKKTDGPWFEVLVSFRRYEDSDEEAHGEALWATTIL